MTKIIRRKAAVSAPEPAPVPARRARPVRKAARTAVQASDGQDGPITPARRVRRSTGASGAATGIVKAPHATMGPDERRTVVKGKGDASTPYSTGDRWKDGGEIRSNLDQWTQQTANLPECKFVQPSDSTPTTWPTIDPDAVAHTYYMVRKGAVVGFSTNCGGGLMLGWDMCGGCGRYWSQCRCKAVSPPRFVVHAYRQRHNLPYDPARRGYIGLVHDQPSGKGRMVIESPNKRVGSGGKKIIRRKPVASAPVPEPEPAPTIEAPAKRRVVIRRKK